MPRSALPQLYVAQRGQSAGVFKPSLPDSGPAAVTHRRPQRGLQCDLTDPVGLSQPTVSHNLKQLTEAGLIIREQRGKWAYYRVVQLALATRDCPLREEAGHLM